MASDPNILTVFRGDTLNRALNFYSDTSNTIPINITGWTIYFTIKRNQDDTDVEAVIQKTITTHTDAINGQSQLLVLASELDSLSGKYWYDIQIKQSDGTITTVTVSRFIANKDITRTTT